MEPNEQQFERMARYLDGEPIELTAAESSFIEQFERNEAMLAQLADIRPPAAAMLKARGRMYAELARPQRRTRWFAVPAAAVAVAAILIAAVLIWRPVAVTRIITVPTELFVEAHLGPDENMDLDLIEADVQELRAAVFASLLSEPAQTRMDALGDMVESFWVAEADDFLDEG